jgi:hypothetical protein
MMQRRDALGFRDLSNFVLAQIDWRGELLMLALLIAESAITYLYLGLLLPELTPPYEPFPAWLIFALFIAGYELPHLLELLRVWGPLYQLTLIGILIVSFALTMKFAAFPHVAFWDTTWLLDTVHGLILRPTTAVRPVWAIIAVVAYTWWRGRLRGEPMIDSAYMMLRWGTLAVTIGLLLILMAAPDEAIIRQRMSGAVIIYFAAALTAIGIGRLRLEGIRSGSPLGPRWFATFAAPILSVLLIAILGAAIFSRRFLDTVLIVLGPLLWVIGLIFRLIIILIALLAFIIIAPILWFLQRQGFGQFSSDLNIPAVFHSFAGFREFTLNRLNVADPLRYLVVGIIFFLLISALTRFAFHRRRHWRDTAEEQRESVMSLGEAFSALSLNLGRLFRPWRRDDSLAKLRGDPRWAHTVTIRETYRRLQQWGARVGVEQPPNATATEYAPDLAARFPAAEAAIRTIITTYTVSRYSGVPATAEEADKVRQAWETLRKLKGT